MPQFQRFLGTWPHDQEPGMPAFATAKLIRQEPPPRMVPTKTESQRLGDVMLHVLSRRRLLASAAAVPILSVTANGEIISGKLPWAPFAGEPPRPVNPLGWYFFHPGEAATVEAIVDRLIPADHLSAGGKDCGWALFIDCQ